MTRESIPPQGYRSEPLGGPRMRADIIDVYIARRSAAGVEFLQLLRSSDPLRNTWHPIMGHIEQGETAIQTARRELQEEVALDTSSILGMWALEQVHPYYVAAIDCVVLSPRFVVEVASQWEPALNAEHSAARWVRDSSLFMWPGQRNAADEAARLIQGLNPDARAALRLI